MYNRYYKQFTDDILSYVKNTDSCFYDKEILFFFEALIPDFKSQKIVKINIGKWIIKDFCSITHKNEKFYFSYNKFPNINIVISNNELEIANGNILIKLEIIRYKSGNLTANMGVYYHDVLIESVRGSNLGISFIRNLKISFSNNGTVTLDSLTRLYCIKFDSKNFIIKILKNEPGKKIFKYIAILNQDDKISYVKLWNKRENKRYSYVDQHLPFELVDKIHRECFLTRMENINYLRLIT